MTPLTLMRVFWVFGLLRGPMILLLLWAQLTQA